MEYNVRVDGNLISLRRVVRVKKCCTRTVAVATLGIIRAAAAAIGG